ncbi:ABC transporter ATP-binding protein [Parerythrobacter jejuensis]|uniref:ATP-binding cassette domain-containing protein n=1 Tax=Parerythrobacter jejuensis TaxID=795812 RepID=A0A845AT75_9SPHN|nr:ABC transporter ATP-binding protein [Parerythrobacter jejuensis]MXP32699.1 ATP-binding cassette domain-containing protein [Parerythrobacter jejuensis]
MSLQTQSLGVDGRLVDATMALEPGTVTAICGPNGAGKSTLLTALAGLQDGAHGDVVLDGVDIAQLEPRERARRIGYLPQDGEVAWDMSVRNLIALGRLPHGDQGDSAIDCAISALDLGSFTGRPVSTLSGGERARVLLARVLAGEPDWILADEPLASLDLAHQFTLIDHLRAQADAGAGVVLVLHDLAMARNHADRVVLLDQGRIVADAKPDKALAARTIAEVFKVNGEWIGPVGQMAFSCYPTKKDSG